MDRTCAGWLLVSALTLLLFSDNASAQGQSLGNGVYACDGAAQAGPCQPDSGDYGDGGGTVYVDKYGAHAVDPERRQIFWAVGADTQDEARSEAISKCRKRTGSECRSLGTFQNTCLTYAFDAGGTGEFPGYGPTADEAAGIAMSECRANGGKCYMMALPVCSGIQYTLTLVNWRAKSASPEEIAAYSERFDGDRH
jgi:hypothetical protein